jgi:hypothetical protein
MLASRTEVEPRLVGVAAVKEKRPVVIQRNLAAWIALYRTLRTHGNAYWTLSGLLFFVGWSISHLNLSVQARIELLQPIFFALKPTRTISKEPKSSILTL